MKHIRRHPLVLVAGFLLLVVNEVRGQATFGVITGNITDPSGGTVPNAKIEVTNEATGIT